ncbi:MAG: TonB-dependent receptor [Pseudomonadota bacterium]|nr:TonB-dependent receptor [Pseudomonadota bacterium]
MRPNHCTRSNDSRRCAGRVLHSACLIWLTIVSPISAAACELPVATALSIQGTVKIRAQNDTEWGVVHDGVDVCPNHTLHVGANSRLTLALQDHTILRLGPNTVISLGELENSAEFRMNVVKGLVHFISRVQHHFQVDTPYVNAAIDGTEFLIDSTQNQTRITVFEGRVRASNEAGSLLVQAGSSIVARGDAPPAVITDIRPWDAVHWMLYYPLPGDLADWPGEQPGMESSLQRAIDWAKVGQIDRALEILEHRPAEDWPNAAILYRAALFLAVGRAGAAESDLARLLDRSAPTPDEQRAHALALQAIIAVTQNRQQTALNWAEQAVAVDSTSLPGYLALSYARQAVFDLPGATQAAESALNHAPDHTVARARVAELALANGQVRRAVSLAEQAAADDPQSALATRTLGFAHLMNLDTDRAQRAFARATEQDPADPLARLGLGLARIRQGDLTDGRRQLEIAASLAPNNALVRSYLGKAYFEQGRVALAETQYALAKTLDPNDPTPWLYSAFLKGAENAPVQALEEAQGSIERNDRRGVYRSRLMLDEDLAVRSTSLGRVYQELGFDQLARQQAVRSLDADPTQAEAHRFLATAFADLPRHEVGRLSEQLQARLWRGFDAVPSGPQLNQEDLRLTRGLGPSSASPNEYARLFLQDGPYLYADLLGGQDGLFGDEIVAGIRSGRWAANLGHYHYETDGFRDNADREQDIIELFAQNRLNAQTDVQLEIRRLEKTEGDITQFYLPDQISPNLRQSSQVETLRLGVKHAFTPARQAIVSLATQNRDVEVYDRFFVDGVDLEVTLELEGKPVIGEAQHVWRSHWGSLITGAGIYRAAFDEAAKTVPLDVSGAPLIVRVLGPQELLIDESLSFDTDHNNLYVYWQDQLTEQWALTAGLSYDDVDEGRLRTRQANPKLGVTWLATPRTQLRAAAFRTLQRDLVAKGTIEPSHVAGFNQFFDDFTGTRAWRYGAGVDHQLGSGSFLGLQVSGRDMEVPVTDLNTGIAERYDRDEELLQAYGYFAATDRLAVKLSYLFERIEQDEDISNLGFNRLTTQLWPISLRYFHPRGLTTMLTATHARQSGNFLVFPDRRERGESQFWVLDAAIGWQLPARRGEFSVGVKNLLDERFQFQDSDPESQWFYPERFLFGRLTLNFR